MSAIDPGGHRADAVNPRARGARALRGPGAAATTSRVARNAAALVAADAATKLGLLVLYGVIGRVLGVDGFGQYTLATSLAFFIRVSALGTDLILSRDL